MGTLLLIILIERFAPPALRRVSILLGLVIGTIVALLVPGMVDWSGVGDAAWFAVVTPFHFGLPTFEIGSIISLLIVAIVIMTETTGDIIAVGEIVEKPVTRRQLADGLRADGLGTVIGGVFNTFPYTAFAQNVGLVSITGRAHPLRRDRRGRDPGPARPAAEDRGGRRGRPRAVLGGAGVALFGMVAASGIRTLTKVRFNNTNILVVAISVGIALLPTVAPTIYDQFPQWFTLIFDSGISAGAITAILLNLLLNSEEMRATRVGDPQISAHDGSEGLRRPRSSTPTHRGPGSSRRRCWRSRLVRRRKRMPRSPATASPRRDRARCREPERSSGGRGGDPSTSSGTGCGVGTASARDVGERAGLWGRMRRGGASVRPSGSDEGREVEPRGRARHPLRPGRSFPR